MIVLGIVVVILLQVLGTRGDYEQYADKYVFACRRSDFTCFQKQYKHLRDNVLLGCKELDVPVYQTYYIQYSDTQTCVKVSGVESSRLVGVSFDGVNKLLTLMISMPVRFQQRSQNWTLPCKPPEKEFTPKGPHVGPYNDFAGNATMVAQFSFALEKKKEKYYLVIQNEEIDVYLDILDLSNHNRLNQLESRTYEWSEWAYEIVQHVDVPEHVMMPYLHQVKELYNKLPLDRFIALYPTELYWQLGFKYVEPNVVE